MLEPASVFSSHSRCKIYYYTLFLLYLATVSFVLSGCGGGGSDSVDDSGTSSGNDKFSISLSHDKISVAYFESESERYGLQARTVLVSFVGDGAAVGYAPGETQPKWLTIEERNVQADGKRFNVILSIIPFYMDQGTYRTTLRFVAGNLDATDGVYVDLPIELTIGPPPTVYSGSVSFNATTLDSQRPDSQLLNLDFNGLEDLSWSVSLEDVNSKATNWLDAQKVLASPSQLTVNTTRLAPAGTYKVNVLVSYEQYGSQGSKRIPVTYTLTAGEPTLNYVTPLTGNINQAGELILRGIGFATTPILDIQVGGHSVTSIDLISDTEIRLQYPPITTAGPAIIELVTANKNYVLDPGVTFRQPPQTAYANFVLDATANTVVFDSRRDVLIACTGKIWYRLQLDNGEWSIVTQRDVSPPDYIKGFDLTPDARHIVYATGQQLQFIDAQSLEPWKTLDIPYVGPNRTSGYYGWTNVRHVLNNGSVLMTMHDGSVPRFLVYHLSNDIVEHIELDSYGVLTRTTSNRDKVFIVPNQVGYAFFGYLNASTNEFQDLPYQGKVSSNRIALSGNGERLFLYINGENTIYDADLNALGTVAEDAVINSSNELSQDGTAAYKVAIEVGAENSAIHVYALSGTPPYTLTNTIPFTFSNARGSYLPPKTQVSPDGRMMFLSGGWISASIEEKRLVIVPLE